MAANKFPNITFSSQNVYFIKFLQEDPDNVCNSSSRYWLDWAKNWYFLWIVKLVNSIAHVVYFDSNIIDTNHKVQTSIVMHLSAKTINMQPKILLNIKAYL